MNELIIQYLNEQKANGLKDSSILKERQVLKALDEHFASKNLKTVTKIDLIDYINTWQLKDATKVSRKMTIRKFFRWLGKEDVVKDIKTRMKFNYLKSDDILTVEDVQKLIDTTPSHYYKALIAVLFETGARISEVIALKVSDFKEADRGMIVEVPTLKTNFPPRPTLLPFSAQHIRNLFLYSDKKKDDIVFDINRHMIHDMLQKIKKKAGITKPVSAHKFRHAQATDMVRRGYNESIIRKKLGWTPTSPMIARYQHLNDDDVINATLLHSGIKVKTESKHQTQLRPADPINIVNSSMQLSKIAQDQIEINSKVDTIMKTLKLLNVSYDFKGIKKIVDAKLQIEQ